MNFYANYRLKNTKKLDISLIYDAIEYISAIKYDLLVLVITKIKIYPNTLG